MCCKTQKPVVLNSKAQKNLFKKIFIEFSEAMKAVPFKSYSRKHVKTYMEIANKQLIPYDSFN